MNDANYILGNKIRDFRENKDMTQKELSAMIGLTPKMISFYENCQRTPPLDVLIKLSNIFNVTLDDLVSNKPVKSGESASKVQITWGDVLNCFPDAVRISGEHNDLIQYYNVLSKTDRRWIMGQIIDLIKKSVHTTNTLPKAVE